MWANTLSLDYGECSSFNCLLLHGKSMILTCNIGCSQLPSTRCIPSGGTLQMTGASNCFDPKRRQVFDMPLVNWFCQLFIPRTQPRALQVYTHVLPRKDTEPLTATQAIILHHQEPRPTEGLLTPGVFVQPFYSLRQYNHLSYSSISFCASQGPSNYHLISITHRLPHHWAEIRILDSMSREQRSFFG